MKRILTLSIVLLSVLSVMAQGSLLSTKSKKAVELYQEALFSNNYQTREALLMDAIKKDKYFVEAYWLLARDYNSREMANEAIALLSGLYEEKFPRQQESYMELAEAYYLSGNYEQAVQTMALCQDMNFIRRREVLEKRYKNALDLFSKPVELSPQRLANVNTQYDNYFPSITADGQIISTTVLVTENADKGQRPHEDIYQSIKVKDQWSNAVALDPPMNTAGNEGSQSFSADGRYMFFVSCDNRNNIGGCDMYYAIRRGRNWSAPINMGDPVNTHYWESNPVLSPTGDELYFTSNRPGGQGEADIWRCKVKILDSGMLQFGVPENLGPSINTAGSEFAPFIHADNQTLYYSSDGIDGLGRRDIYMARRNGNKFVNPVNLGYPINTHGDESGFVVDASGVNAYFASNKLDSTSDRLQIYMIELPHELRPEPMTYFVGRVVDAKSKKPLQARVEIYSLKDNVKHYGSLTDATNGTFTAYLPTMGQYGVSVTRPNYLFYTDAIPDVNEVLQVEMQPFGDGSRTTIQNLFFDFNSDAIMPESFAAIERLYEFLKQNPRIKVTLEGHTDNVGSSSYNLDLSKRRANAVRQALIDKGIKPERIMSIGQGNSSPIATNDTEEGRAQNRRVELIYGQDALLLNQ